MVLLSVLFLRSNGTAMQTTAYLPPPQKRYGWNHRQRKKTAAAGPCYVSSLSTQLVISIRITTKVNGESIEIGYQPFGAVHV